MATVIQRDRMTQ